MVSAPRGFYPILNNGELASLLSFILIYFVFSGPGPWSLDRMMKLNDHPTDAESDHASGSPHAKSSHARKTASA
jgi:hypothetical protein